MGSFGRRLNSMTCAIVYAVVLTAGMLYLLSLNPDARTAVLFRYSTNVHNLIHSPLQVLLGSMIFVDDAHYWYWVVGGAITLAICQARVGWRTTVAVVLSAHISITLITEAAVWLLVKYGAMSKAHLTQVDIGPSYIFVAAATLAIIVGPRAARGAAVLILAPLAIMTIIAIHEWDLAASGHTLVIVLVLIFCAVKRRNRL